MLNGVKQDGRAPQVEWLSERTCVQEVAPARLVLWVRAPGQSATPWFRVAFMTSLNVAFLTWVAVNSAPAGLLIFGPLGAFLAVTGLWFFFGNELITAEPYRLTIQRRLWNVPTWIRRVVGPDHLTSLEASPAYDRLYWDGWGMLGPSAGTIVIREWGGRFGEFLATDEAESIIDRLQPVLFGGPPPVRGQAPEDSFWSRD